MSQVTLDIIKGVCQAAADAYDGALDDKGEPVEIGGKGLKREKGHPVYDSRTVDGFKVKVHGDQLIVTYQSDIKLKDVYTTNFENEMEICLNDIKKYIQKRYKKITKNTLNLSSDSEAQILVQTTSRVRVFVTATKVYKIGGLENVDSVETTSRSKIEQGFKNFLDQGGWGNKPENKNQRASKK